MSKDISDMVDSRIFYNNENYYDYDEETDNSDINDEIYFENNTNLVDETAKEIRKNMISYAKDNGYHLCEFLNIENVHNFTNYILNR